MNDEHHDEPPAFAAPDTEPQPGPEPVTSPNGFADLGLRPELLETVLALGYEEPTPIQRETIPHLLEGSDLLGQAATGTGKTAAFALPALNMIDSKGPAVPQVLVLVPTRELAVQVSEAMFKYGRKQRRHRCFRSSAASRSAVSSAHSTVVCTSSWPRPGERSTTSVAGR